MIEELKLGWIIGIIEGEGWIGSDKGGRPKIQVASTDMDVIYRMLEWSGVGVVSEANERTITGKRVWRWAIYAREDAGKFIELILPHLCERRKLKAEEVLDKWKALAPKRGTSPTCQHGHLLVGNNLVIREERRRCKECINARARAYRVGKTAADVSW